MTTVAHHILHPGRMDLVVKITESALFHELNQDTPIYGKSKYRILPYDRAVYIIFTALHCVVPHCMPLHRAAYNYTALHTITPLCIPLHRSACHCPTLHATALLCMRLHRAALHFTAMHGIALPRVLALRDLPCTVMH